MVKSDSIHLGDCIGTTSLTGFEKSSVVISNSNIHLCGHIMNTPSGLLCHTTYAAPVSEGQIQSLCMTKNILID